MRTTARIKWLLLMLLATGCGSSSTTFEYEEPGGEAHTVAYLKSLCPPNGTHLITQSVNICGVVTANDKYGEYNKSIVIQDATGGIEISIDTDRLAWLFPINSVVKVYCHGLAVGDYGGKPLLGAPPQGSYTVDRIPSGDVDRYIRPVTDSGLSRNPTSLGFSEVALRHADTYVRFDGVRFEESGHWCDTDPETGKWITTHRTLLDAEGRRFTIRTLGTCRYAAEPVPQGTGSVNGIIDYFNGEFSLRVTNAETDFPL